ncbi:protein mono-ADP-ribosyltransferase PARP10-like [Watersipora subatra]|uniref:protein mono-ADP-ribosyltransferase PARP10-like n=1 Tax=Watersipora subatra TaxID=2589382 RepID=UPI00355C8489
MSFADITPEVEAALFAPPAHWAALPYGEYQYKLHPENDRDEYQRIANAFANAADPNAKYTIVEITRVQNIEQLIQFEAQKQKLLGIFQANNVRLPVERRLWHGTSEECALDIMRQEFNRSFTNTRHGHDFGEGSYFHVNSTVAASLSDMLPHPMVILSRVLTGRFEKGARNITQALLQERVESTVDDVNNPSIFAVYHDCAAYPEYTVKLAFKPA